MTITGKTRVVGLWGNPVTHSKSPAMHNAAFEALKLDWVYVPFLVELGSIPETVASIRALNLVGVNATVPLKELISPYLDWIDPVARRINSVNTIVNSGGELRGYSTDGEGLLWDLKSKNALPKSGSNVLILGAGGSARAAAAALDAAGFEVRITNRSHERAIRLANDLDLSSTPLRWEKSSVAKAVRDSSLVVNTTTIGMDSVGQADIEIFSDWSMSAEQTLYDLVYSPPETALMKLAQDAGGRAINGLGMLVRQGAVSLHHWSGLPLNSMPIEVMESAIQKKME